MVTCASIREGLQDLYSIFGIRVEVNVQTFSFLSEHFQQQQSTLQSADIFWFAGVHVLPPKLKQALSGRDIDDHVNDLAAHVRRRVQFDHMTYVGVCGGASMASSPETCVYGCGLDLLQGLEVCQVWNNDDRYNHANMIDDRLAFTYGCALAVVLEPQMVAAVCFPVVKNAGNLWGFAAANSQLTQRIVQRLGNQWTQFVTRGGDFKIWFFNLRGYYRFLNCDELHLV